MPNKKINRLETIPDEFSSQVEKSQKDVFKELQAQINRLEVKAGKFIVSKKNLLLVEDINTKLKEGVYKSSYIDAVKKFVNEFDEQASITNTYFSSVFEQKITSETAKQITLVYKRKALDKLVGNGLEANFLTPARDILENAVASGSDWLETISAIQDFAIGNEDIDGKLFRYSKQIASDLFSVSDRAYTNNLSNEIGAEWFEYAGDIIKDSREFCVARHGKFFHKKEVEAWASLGDWQGRMLGTDEQTIFVTAGGYQCRHSILPVSVFRVPMEVVQRNIASGNYKPNDKVKKELGI